MKTTMKKLYLFLLMVCFVGIVNAQSMRKYNFQTRSVGDIVINKTSNSTFEILPAGVLSYKIQNGNEVWALFNGIMDAQTGPDGFIKKTNDEINFYGNQKELRGCYVPSEGRFYIVSGAEYDLCKRESIAIFDDNVLVVNTVEEDVYKRFVVDKEVNVEMIGFYLFIY